MTANHTNRKRLSQWARSPALGPLIALLVIYGLFSCLSPNTFLGWINFTTMIRQTVVVAIVAVGMTLIMVQGGIDLSVGSLVALTTVVIARSIQAGHSALLASVFGLAVALCAGLFNGTLVVLLRITPFIVTLGTMSILRGLAKGIAHEQKIERGKSSLSESGWLSVWLCWPLCYLVTAVGEDTLLP